MMTGPDDDLLADGYVLGLLDPEGQADAERRMERDTVFATRVVAAARRFTPLDDSATPMSLPDGAWARLEGRLAAPVEPSPPAAASAPGRTPRSAANLKWTPLPLALALALAASLLLAVGLAWPLLRGLPFGGPAGAVAMAVLLDPDGAPFALIEDFGNGEAAVTTLAAYQVPEGASLQAWTKWSEEVGPVSLGVLDTFAGAPLGADEMPRPVAGQLYEITLEEEGGSATGRPTGPILGVGRASIPG